MSVDLSGIEVTTLTGPPLVAIILNWGLFGVLSIQVYLYSQAFPKDRPILKAVVYSVYLLETTQIFLLTKSVWDILAQGFGSLEGLDDIGISPVSVCLIDGLVGLLVQCFYAYRISVISQRWIIPSFIITLSLTSFAGALASTVYGIRAGQFTELPFAQRLGFKIKPLGLWIGPACACDALITICMCYYLHIRKPLDATFSKTIALLSRLIRMTIETGALVASVSVLTLALFYSSGLNHFIYFVVPLSAQAKLYSTTMMAVLNSRMKIGMVSESTSGWRDHEPTLPRSVAMSEIIFNITSSIGPSQSVGVFVLKEEVITTDESNV